jgi:diguanylate cyclase (GGDEF)-like protein
VVARYGGEEFSILLPDSNAAEAAGIAERIRLEIAALAIAHADGAHGVITASIGIASIYPVFGDQPVSLIQQADGALYAAKGGGRNRVICSVVGEAIRVAA